MARRQNHTLVLVLAVFGFLFFLTYIFSVPSAPPSQPVLNSAAGAAPKGGVAKFEEQKAQFAAAGETKGEKGFKLDLDEVAGSGILGGESIAPKLENATLKAELGRATWHFLHTMVAKFPDEPTDQDRTTLETFFSLFGRLYPCGDCAKHFREMLAKYPPQTSSRSNAAGWLCYVHNVVNERLEKEIFDCNNIGDFYDCGCGEEGKDSEKKVEGEVQEEIKREDDEDEKKGEAKDGEKTTGSGDGEGVNTEEVTTEDRIKEQVEEVDEGKEKKEEGVNEKKPASGEPEQAEKIRE